MSTPKEHRVVSPWYCLMVGVVQPPNALKSEKLGLQYSTFFFLKGSSSNSSGKRDHGNTDEIKEREDKFTRHRIKKQELKLNGKCHILLVVVVRIP